MSDLSAASEALGIPEALVKRSAEARAAETGSTVEEILAAWAGGEKAPASSSPPPEAAADEPTVDEAGADTDEADAGEAEAPAPTPEVKVEIPDRAQPAAQPAAVSRVAVAAEVGPAEAANLPVVVTVPTTGIKERTNFVVPRWLALVFLAAPAFALFALGGSATGTCGEATELRTDVITGEVVNCDGSPFEGSSVGGGGTDFIALGESIYQGGAVSGVNCAGCHGAGGGGGAGPALNGVLTVFGACLDHAEWVALGTGGFQQAGESTYGDTNKPLGGFGAAMPGFAGSLSAEQIAAVAAFERVRFGGQAPEEALVDCGLGEEPPAEGESGEPPADGEPGTEDGTTEETTPETTPDTTGEEPPPEG